MKIFIYKTLIVICSIYILFQFTIGQMQRDYENKLVNLLYNKQQRIQILEKIKEEVRAANQKENLFTIEERELISNFINKIQKELSVNNAQ